MPTEDDQALYRHYPAMAVVEVSALIEDPARIEIETTAVMPDPGPPAVC